MRVTRAMMFRLLMLCLLTAALYGRLGSPASADIIDGSRIIEQTLDNGIRVIVKPEHAVPVVSGAVVVRGGSSVEDRDEHGLAHVVEHMVFQRPREGIATASISYRLAPKDQDSPPSPI